ncbi:hypothetical protein [Anatilimnocola floriformis]|uniref:hypothetical protein n=1 Tax=Anatilimnocola floriformis TaxID=2948575 RepID=UPI0020C1CB73|nr:hypothetical protein [Anatilimnocola floriformis]
MSAATSKISRRNALLVAFTVVGLVAVGAFALRQKFQSGGFGAVQVLAADGVIFFGREGGEYSGVAASALQPSDIVGLKFSRSTAQPADLNRMRQLPGILTVTIEKCDNADNILETTSTLPGCRCVDILGSQISNKGVDAIRRHGELAQLTVKDISLKELDMRLLGKLPKVRILTLQGRTIDDSVLDAVTELFDVQFLGLEDCSVSDLSFASIARMSNLESLAIIDTSITGAGFKHLAKLKKLSRVRLQDCDVDDSGLFSLSTIGSLETVRIGSLKTTASGVSQLGEKVRVIRD